MTIGKLPAQGELADLGRWYFGFELSTHPPYKIRCFQPYLFVWCVKVLEHGDEGKVDGSPGRRVGGYRRFVFPWSISIEISRG